MKREEAIERIKMIIEEATANEDAVSYVTSYDADALDMAIKALEQEPKTGWIPVSESLPEKGKQVLCCNKSGSVFTSAITYINSNGMVAFGQHYEVIAWMPLPEPYKEREG